MKQVKETVKREAQRGKKVIEKKKIKKCNYLFFLIVFVFSFFFS